MKPFGLKDVFDIFLRQDTIVAKRNLTDYEGKDLTLKSSREGKFAQMLADSVEQHDLETFTQTVGDYDQVLKLDNWKTSILLKIKKLLETEEDDGIL